MPLKSTSEMTLYLRVLILGILVCAACYFYTTFNKIPSTFNKSVADTSVILMGLSMVLSSVCFFWDRFDSFIIYRKQLGLIGFGFGLLHVGLSWEALEKLFLPTTWATPAYQPILAGVLGLIIFSMMALISNQFAAHKLGGRNWRYLLRTGYLAMFFIWIHVVLLKMVRWMAWYKGGMKTLPSISLMISLFIIVILVMRGALAFSLYRKRAALKKIR
jgi:DMSO/TMAO reductase YedYZ heme-binding membrane subunit